MENIIKKRIQSQLQNKTVEKLKKSLENTY